LEIHASTQQTVTCADGVSFAADRTNATRVVSRCFILFVFVFILSTRSMHIVVVSHAFPFHVFLQYICIFNTEIIPPRISPAPR
jgi:hypothetical protein